MTKETIIAIIKSAYHFGAGDALSRMNFPEITENEQSERLDKWANLRADIIISSFEGNRLIADIDKMIASSLK